MTQVIAMVVGWVCGWFFLGEFCCGYLLGMGCLYTYPWSKRK